MKKSWFIADTHFDHQRMIIPKDGLPRLRNFDTIEQHNKHIVDRCNAVVQPNDVLYIVGDVALRKSGLEYINQINCKKRLIMGNHDILSMYLYLDCFEQILGSKEFRDESIICTHIPIAIEQKGRYALNIHGHIHDVVLEDSFYYNVSMEQLNDYTPICFDDIVKYMRRYLPKNR